MRPSISCPTSQYNSILFIKRIMSITEICFSCSFDGHDFDPTPLFR